MTLPASGPLLLGTAAGGNSVNSEFGYGNDMASYQGVYCGLGGSLIRLPTVGNSLAMNVFYSTYKISGGSQTFTTNQSFVIPVYNTLTITTSGDQGGQSGAFGVFQCNPPYYATPSSDGNSSGVSSSFGGYLSSGSGAGGSGNGVSGTYGPVNTITLTNPLQGGTGPASGATVNVIVGPGGSGGAGGPIYSKNYLGYCVLAGNAASGNRGATGSVSISWS